MFERLKKLINKRREWKKSLMDKKQDFSYYAGSGIMQTAIREWLDLYSGSMDEWRCGSTSSLKKRKSLNLPRRIACEISRLVCLEAEFNILGDSDRACYLREQLAPFMSRMRTAVEYAAAGGGMVFKPYAGADGTIAIDTVQADRFCPIAYNSSGVMISAAFFETKVVNTASENEKYLRVEKHLRDGNGYIITNRAYRLERTSVSTGSGTGDCRIPNAPEIPLSSVPEWAAIEPEVVIENLDVPLFSYFKIPKGNTIDRGSPLGVSVYADVVNLIRDADTQYDLLLWEYEGGAMALDVSQDAFDKDENGQAIIPEGRERLYRSNKFSVDDGTDTDLYKIFAPELRDSSYNDGLETILRQIENGCGLAYGTLSRADETVKTATEIIKSKQRSYSTVTEIQKSLQGALEGLTAAMDALCDLYELSPAGSYTTSALWDDSIVNDPETERIRDMQEVREGLMAKWEYRVKWYGEDENTAKRAVGGDLSDEMLMRFGDA